jgi:hypothetical protein
LEKIAFGNFFETLHGAPAAKGVTFAACAEANFSVDTL